LKAIDSVDKSSTGELWLIFFRFILSKDEKYDFKSFHPYFKRSLSQLFFSSSFKDDLLKICLSSFNNEDIRIIYNDILDSYTPSSYFFKSCLVFEKNIKPQTHSIIWNLYSLAVDKYGSDDFELWLDWILWEKEQGNFESLDNLVWEAKKKIEKPRTFYY